MPSYTAPAKWNSLMMMTKCHDLSITQDLRGISFFLLSNINKMHANWLSIVELRHEVPAKAPSRISEEAVMMAIACNPATAEAEQEELKFKPRLRSQDQPKIY